MMEGVRKLFKRYTPDFILDSMMCHGDPLWVERRFVAWIDKDEIYKIWEYVSSYFQEHGEPPSYTKRTMRDVADVGGVDYSAVDRWLAYCLTEARRQHGPRAPPFRFADTKSRAEG